MKLPEGAIVQVVLKNEAMQALIGDRYYPHPADKNTPYPFVSYQRISTIPRQTLTGRSSMSGIRLQLNVWSDKSMTECATIAETLSDALDGFKGQENGLEIKWVMLDENDANGAITYDEALRIWGCSFDVIVTYKRGGN